MVSGERTRHLDLHSWPLIPSLLFHHILFPPPKGLTFKTSRTIILLQDRYPCRLFIGLRKPSLLVSIVHIAAEPAGPSPENIPVLPFFLFSPVLFLGRRYAASYLNGDCSIPICNRLFFFNKCAASVMWLAYTSRKQPVVTPPNLRSTPSTLPLLFNFSVPVVLTIITD